MSDRRPAPTAGLRHVALFVTDLAAAEHFYCDLLGMAVEWRPDPDNVYLSGGNDNLALHRMAEGHRGDGDQRLDHIGYILNRAEDVTEWHDFMLANGVTIRQGPKSHRDGTRSFYCYDPDGNLVQLIHHPGLVGSLN
ncbi:MAG: VOC family protein [Gammaproteobacteria bacterium]|nr:VOC family protein [Gammaproteobacteria bacterium]